MKKQEESRNKVGKSRKKLRITRNKQKRYTQQEKDAFGKQYIEGKSLYEIAKENKDEPGTSNLYEWKKKYGWDKEKQRLQEQIRNLDDAEKSKEEAERLRSEKEREDRYVISEKDQLKALRAVFTLAMVSMTEPKPVFFADGTPMLDGNGNQVMEPKVKFEKASDAVNTLEKCVKLTRLIRGEPTENVSSKVELKDVTEEERKARELTPDQRRSEIEELIREVETDLAFIQDKRGGGTGEQAEGT